MNRFLVVYLDRQQAVPGTTLQVSARAQDSTDPLLRAEASLSVVDL